VQNGHLKLKVAKLDQEVRVGGYLQGREEAKVQRKMRVLQGKREEVGKMRGQERYLEEPKQFVEQMTQELVEEKTQALEKY